MFFSFYSRPRYILTHLLQIYPLCLANPIKSAQTPEPVSNSLKQNSKEESSKKLPDLSLNDNSMVENTTRNYFSWANLDPLPLLGGWMKTMYKQPSRLVRKIPRKFSKKSPVKVLEKPDISTNISLNEENSLSGT